MSAPGTRTVALLGATGYTGRLVAAELVARGIPHRLGGRSPDRLAAVPSEAPRHVVDLTDPQSLDALLDGADVLISCVGPFALHGRPAVQAAVRNGTPYLDSTGEPDFMAQVYAEYASAPVALVPACGFDYLPGDLAAAVAVSALGGPAERVTVVYRLAGGRPSRGTARSAVGALRGVRTRPRRLQLDGPEGLLSAVEVPWGELLTVPRHAPGAVVRTGLVSRPGVARAADLLGPAVPALAPLTRLAGPLLERLVERLPEGPEPEQRGRATCMVLAEAGAGSQRARVMVTCRDAYGLTARLLVAASQRITGTGAMAPAQALDARSFLDTVSGEDAHGALTWRML